MNAAGFGKDLMMTPSKPKRILLIIGGGIAAYKVLELIRRAQERGIAVTPVMTTAAKHFVTPLSVASLARTKVHEDLFALTDEAEMGHIELSRAADLVVVAPATADLLAKMAQGIANDLASTLLLATDTENPHSPCDECPHVAASGDHAQYRNATRRWRALRRP